MPRRHLPRSCGGWSAATRSASSDGFRAAATLSAGVAGGFGGHLELEALVRDADNAMYSAKALGRDQVYVFHELEDNGLVRRGRDRAERPQPRHRGRPGGVWGRDRFAHGRAGCPTRLGRQAIVDDRRGRRRARAGLGLPESEIERIRVASLLHDLGKLAIPEEILTKPGELNDPEWRIVSEHPKIGQVILEQAGALRDAATIVLHHHEWFDGRGYPHGLAGEEIPVGARIVAIADAYEAMVAGRPYRDAISHEAAIAGASPPRRAPVRSATRRGVRRAVRRADAVRRGSGITRPRAPSGDSRTSAATRRSMTRCTTGDGASCRPLARSRLP